MSTLSRYFFSSLLPCLFLLPWFLVLLHRRLAWEFSRGACFLGSLGGWLLYLSSSGSGLRVGPGSDVRVALFSSSGWAYSSYSILGSSPPTHIIASFFIYLNDQLNYIYRWFSTKKREEEEDLWINYMTGCFE